jgi:hypothetical protein
MSDPKLRVEAFCSRLRELLSWLKEAAVTYDVVIEEIRDDLNEFSGAPLESKKIYCDSIERKANSLLQMHADIARYLLQIPQVADEMQQFMNSSECKLSQSQKAVYINFLLAEKKVFDPIKSQFALGVVGDSQLGWVQSMVTHCKNVLPRT